ncbi:putative tubulin-specific chaperone a [Neospora caninum Liverpool]|uniref:Tubulin-specific chaperone A n=1 Tax=Neospora caninum (strain Liverpool) TaxID=572307 RepID=F0V7R5_NEOCL|nr:putative tubulin-specific chaperone a [Neospora caninum Liverpool]CBZ49756.1 putative tubulin-specific chaperone a [Neospora caninum Liverpool]CEL64341.1 TPA: tubulin-specific chaperone a, putative [Neospora caninum Liverpool]|eukprot:XP_003879791.1 putative tubulin-specific chaperone a [Neospora caninum Liverpool]
MASGSSGEYLRFLRIKHKVVQRLLKEVKYYQMEVEQHRQTVLRMKAENRDPSDIKQLQNVYDETVVMVPDSEQRLLRACADLDEYMLSNRDCRDAVHKNILLLREACAATKAADGAEGEDAQSDTKTSSAAGLHAAGTLEAEVCDIIATAQRLGLDVSHLHIQFRVLDMESHSGGAGGGTPESENEEDI